MAACPMLPINVELESAETAIGKGLARQLHISGNFTFILFAEGSLRKAIREFGELSARLHDST